MSLLAKLREFTGGSIEQYLKTEHRQNLRSLELTLRALGLKENFNGFEWDGTIPAGSQMQIRNLLSPVIPTRRIILRSSNGQIGDGAIWTRDSVYLENLSGSDDTVKVVFLP